MAIDLMGFGASDRPRISYDLDTQYRYLLGYMDAISVERAVLIGTSMGASLALWTAAHASTRVEALILFAPSAYPGSLRYAGMRGYLQRPSIGNRIARTAVRFPWFDWVFPYSLARQALDVTSSYSPGFAKSLEQVATPTLMFWAVDDGTVPYRYAARYADVLPSVEIVDLPPGVRHGGPQYQPEELAARICRFLDTR
jgi:pimeloyl-ACP methyl ester carboxylesterase